MIYCKIICATPPEFIYRANQAGISIYRLTYQNDLTATAAVRQCDYWSFVHIGEQYGADIQPLQKQSSCGYGRMLVRRPILIIGLLSICLLSLFLPTRVLFVIVNGNENVPQNRIVEAAEACGLHFGTARRNLRSEQIKNELLSKVPQLQWVGVNTYGCVAEISVEEKYFKEEQEKEYTVSSIVAAQDGIVCDLVALSGNAVCSVGQAVIKGETLISGFTDCGHTTKAERANGTVYAYTLRHISAFNPINNTLRAEETGRKVKFYLRIGKKIINLCINSGISDTGCAKIYEQRNIQLPGGFQLPVSFVRETEIFYRNTDDEIDYDLLTVSALAEEYLQSQMTDGVILNRSYTFEEIDGAMRLEGTYSCKEMIGRERKEELPIWEKK